MSDSETQGAQAPRTVAEVREHLEAQLARALLSPGMYGGEVVLDHMLGSLIWLNGLNIRVEDFFESCGAWSPIGVSGAFTRLFGGTAAANDSAMALAYADLAWSIGCWSPDRFVDRETYDRIRADAPAWASADRLVADVLADFGTPSVWRATFNPRFPISFGYLAEDRALPIIAFDFFPLLAAEPDVRRIEGQEPSPLMLRNIRWRTNSLPDDLICTPFGAEMRAEEQKAAMKRRRGE